jgi:hypothetical protein
MEAVCAAGAVTGSAVSGYLIGRSVTRSLLLVTLGGLFASAFWILFYFIGIFVLHRVFPGLVEPWDLGRYLIMVAVLAPVAAVIAAAVNRRRTAHADATRLPF